MKKNRICFIGILIMLLLLSNTLVSCDNGNGSDSIPKSIRITGFNLPDRTRVSVEVIEGFEPDFIYLAKGQTENIGSTMTFDLYEYSGYTDDFVETTRWTGSGNYYIGIVVRPSITAGKSDTFYLHGPVGGNWPDQTVCNIKDSITTLDFGRDFFYAWDGE